MERTLLVSFPDQSQTFTLGFEAGMIWARIEAREPAIEATVRAENGPVLRRMAAARGYDISFGASEMIEWEFVRLTLPGGGGGRRAVVSDAAAREMGPIHAARRDMAARVVAARR